MREGSSIRGGGVCRVLLLLLYLLRYYEQIDESINYVELIYKPTTIIVFPANNGVIGTIFGLIVSGVLFAIQGFVINGQSYDLLGGSQLLAGS